jgi:hypothetical protein
VAKAWEVKKTNKKTTYYLGTSGKGVKFPVEELNPVDGNAKQIKFNLTKTVLNWLMIVAKIQLEYNFTIYLLEI